MSYPKYDLTTAYSSSPEFNAETLPKSLQASHSTKSGTHAVLEIQSGQLKYVDEINGDEREMQAGEHQLIKPDAPHHVELMGEARLQIFFFHEPPTAL